MSARDGRVATNGHTGNESLRLTRVRGVPLASETLCFSKLGGVHQACSSVAILDGVLSRLTSTS